MDNTEELERLTAILDELLRRLSGARSLELEGADED